MFNNRKKRIGRNEIALQMDYPVILGIVGYRNFTDYDLFQKKMLLLIKELGLKYKDIGLIVSGGANGADLMAEKWADERKLETKIYYPNLSLGKRGFALRNKQIVDLSTHIIAFPSRTGKGTQITIKMAKNANVPIKIAYVD